MVIQYNLNQIMRNFMIFLPNKMKFGFVQNAWEKTPNQLVQIVNKQSGFI